MEVALAEAPEVFEQTPWEASLAVSFGKEDDSHIKVSWSVPGAKGNLGNTQVCLCPVDQADMEYYESSYMGRYYAGAYDAKLIREEYAFCGSILKACRAVEMRYGLIWCWKMAS